MQKTIWLLFLGLGLTLACVVPSQLSSQQITTLPPTRTPLPTFTPIKTVVVVVIPPTATPTPIPPTVTPTTELPTPTVLPTNTPTAQAVATDTPIPLPPPTVAPEPKPTTPPQPQPTKPPAPTSPPAPTGGAHGVLVKLTLREGRNTYSAGEKVFVKFEVTNTTGSAIPFGILGLNSDDGRFQTSWDKSEVSPGSPFSHEDGLAFGGKGNHKIWLSICFSTKEICQSANGDWERFEPGVDVVIQ